MHQVYLSLRSVQILVSWLSIRRKSSDEQSVDIPDALCYTLVIMKTLILKETQAPYTLTLDESALAEEPVQVLHSDGGRVVGVIVPATEYAAFCTWRETQQRRQQARKNCEAFEREEAAFEGMLPQLLRDYRGLVVAIHEGQVVEVGRPGESVAEVAGRVYSRIGYVPVYIQQVTETPRVYKITGDLSLSPS